MGGQFSFSMPSINSFLKARRGNSVGFRRFFRLPFACCSLRYLATVSDTLRKRDWPEFHVPVFDCAEIVPATLAYLNIFGKTLPQTILSRLEVTAAARNPLYLRTVLDELRQTGKHEELEIKAADYLSTPDLKDLFNRIIARWDDDFGSDPRHPDLVRRSLCLIACSRFR